MQREKLIQNSSDDYDIFKLRYHNQLRLFCVSFISRFHMKDCIIGSALPFVLMYSAYYNKVDIAYKADRINSVYFM